MTLLTAHHGLVLRDLWLNLVARQHVAYIVSANLVRQLLTTAATTSTTIPLPRPLPLPRPPGCCCFGEHRILQQSPKTNYSQLGLYIQLIKQ